MRAGSREEKETIKRHQTGYDFHLIKFHFIYHFIVEYAKSGCSSPKGASLSRTAFKMNEQITSPELTSELVSRRNLVEKGLQENPIESWVRWPILIKRGLGSSNQAQEILINYQNLNHA